MTLDANKDVKNQGVEGVNQEENTLNEVKKITEDWSNKEEVNVGLNVALKEWLTGEEWREISSAAYDLLNNPTLTEEEKDKLRIVTGFFNREDYKQESFMDYKQESFMESIMDKLDDPKQLNTMEEWDIEMIDNYLRSPEHEKDALTVYSQMKSIKWHESEKWMLDGDIKVFNEIWNNLEKSYSTNDSFINKDYPKLALINPEKPSAESLMSVMKDSGKSWDGRSETINIASADPSIVNENIVKDKVVEANNKRIENNVEQVKNIAKNNVDGIKNMLSRFELHDDWKLFYQNDKGEPVEFTSDNMIRDFKDELMNVNVGDASFVNDGEKRDTIKSEECKTAIFNDVKDYITKEKQKTLDTQKPDTNFSKINEEVGGYLTSENSVEEIRGVNTYVNGKIGTNNVDKEIVRRDDNGNIEYNIDNIKEFLGKIANKDIDFDKNFMEVWSESRKAWISSVQILLNKEYGKNLTVDGQWVEGKDTCTAIQNFQKEYNRDNGYESDSPNYLEPDWVPRPKTIAALLEWEKHKEA